MPLTLNHEREQHEKMNCKICNNKLIKSDLEDFYYCPHCNKKFKISSVKKCKNCSTPLKECEDGAWFCPSCGKKYRFTTVKKENDDKGKVEVKENPSTESKKEQDSPLLDIKLEFEITPDSVSHPLKENPSELNPISTDTPPKEVDELSDIVLEPLTEKDALPSLEDVIESESTDAKREESDIAIDDILDEKKDDFSLNDLIDEDTPPKPINKPKEEKTAPPIKAETKERIKPEPVVISLFDKEEVKPTTTPKETTLSSIRVGTLERMSSKEQNNGKKKKKKSVISVGSILSLIVGILICGLGVAYYVLNAFLASIIPEDIFSLINYVPYAFWGLVFVLAIFLSVRLSGSQKFCGVAYILSAVAGLATLVIFSYGKELPFYEKAIEATDLIAFIPKALIFLGGAFSMILMDSSQPYSKKAGIAGIITAILSALAVALAYTDKVTELMFLTDYVKNIDLAFLGIGFLITPILNLSITKS